MSVGLAIRGPCPPDPPPARGRTGVAAITSSARPWSCPASASCSSCRSSGCCCPCPSIDSLRGDVGGRLANAARRRAGCGATASLAATPPTGKERLPARMGGSRGTEDARAWLQPGRRWQTGCQRSDSVLPRGSAATAWEGSTASETPASVAVGSTVRSIAFPPMRSIRLVVSMERPSTTRATFTS